LEQVHDAVRLKELQALPLPSKKGIGLKAVFDMVNEIYGKDFYRYE
jgi:hypothetical protein